MIISNPTQFKDESTYDENYPTIEGDSDLLLEYSTYPDYITVPLTKMSGDAADFILENLRTVRDDEASECRGVDLKTLSGNPVVMHEFLNPLLIGVADQPFFVWLTGNFSEAEHEIFEQGILDLSKTFTSVSIFYAHLSEEKTKYIRMQVQELLQSEKSVFLRTLIDEESGYPIWDIPLGVRLSLELVCRFMEDTYRITRAKSKWKQGIGAVENDPLRAVFLSISSALRQSAPNRNLIPRNEALAARQKALQEAAAYEIPFYLLPDEHGTRLDAPTKARVKRMEYLQAYSRRIETKEKSSRIRKFPIEMK